MRIKCVDLLATVSSNRDAERSAYLPLRLCYASLSQKRYSIQNFIMDDFNAFLMTPIVDPLDPHRTAELISQPPFVLVPGVANIRDIGGLPIKNSDSNGQRVVRKGRMYRAATLNHITPEGKEALRALDIGAIYDLRTLGEVRRYAKVSPDDLDPRAGLVNLTKEGEIEGEDVKVYHVPLVELSREDPKAQFSKLLKYGRGDQGFLEGYEEILESAGESYGTILRYIMSQSKEGGKACLWHCHGESVLGPYA